LDLKGIVESLIMSLGITSKCEWMTFAGSILFKADKSAKIQLGNNILGYIGEAKELEFKTPPCMVELDLDLLVKMSNFSKYFQTLSQYPPVLRDLAIIVDEEVTWVSIEKCIAAANISFMMAVKFFDIYRGKQIPSGKKSIAFNLCFQAPDRTLRNDEVDVAQQAILDALYRIIGAELRKQ